MATMVNRLRGESQARWQAALQRAFAVGLEVYRLADTRELVVSSATQFDLLHRTDGERCTCEAARHGDPVCSHRAVARFVRGLLDPEPEPAAPAIAAMVPCRDCGGDGYQRIITGGHLSDWWAAPCHACNSTGIVPGEEAPALAA